MGTPQNPALEINDESSALSVGDVSVDNLWCEMLGFGDVAEWRCVGSIGQIMLGEIKLVESLLAT